MTSDVTSPPQRGNTAKHSYRGQGFSGKTTPTRISSRVIGHVPYRNSMLTMVLKDSLGK